MRKRIYSILLAIALLATIIPITVLAEDPPHTRNGYTAISNATELAALFTNGGSGYLTADITTNSDASRLIKAGKTVNLCLNGFVLTLGYNNGQNIGIEGNGVLNLYDCGTKTHKFSVGTNGLWELDETNGTETVTGGVITGGKGGDKIAGAVYMASGANFNMYGGNIVGNQASEICGAVYVDGTSVFNMTGGNIIGNQAQYGGGIYVANGATVDITGGTIENNQASQAGGAVQVDGTFRMSGGTIKNNHSDNDGGGLSVNSSIGNVLLAGTAAILDNTAKNLGGGVTYYNCVSGKVILGGSVQITGNKGGCNNSDGTTQNVYLFSGDNFINIGTDTDAPTSDMQVGITMQTPGRFTVSDEIARENTSYFSSDDPTYLVNCPDTISYLELAKAYQINNKMPMDDMRKNHGAIDVSTDLDAGITEAASGRTIFISANPDTGYECTDVNLISDTTVDLTPAGEGLYSFTMPANNVSISATFKIKTYNVTYNANGHGTAPEAVTADYGSKLTKPANLTASGYTFGGWYTDEDCNTAWDFDNDTVTADTTLYAKWTVVPAPKPEPELEPISYRITQGANSIWVIAAGESPTFRSNAPFEKFSHVLIDGRKLHSSAYKGQSGSTLITLTPEFTATLAPGKHTIEIVSTDGSASTVFYIDNDEIAQTDGSLFKEATMSSGFVGFAIVGLSAIFFELKKKRVK